VLSVATSGIVMRDAKDQPILDAAIAGAVDAIVIGDKDSHALSMSEPAILTPRDYLDHTGEQP
jgi:predicted nucleic acid-binding protein